MNIFAFSDESGVFDKVHNDIFVFGGLVFLDKKSKNNTKRKYINVEKTVQHKYGASIELKASTIKNIDKYSFYRSLNNEIKFAVVIEQKQIFDKIFNDKKHKQRYLDFAFKIGLKNCLCCLIDEGRINKEEVENMYVFQDEHLTATSGKYELSNSLEEEFKRGMFTNDYTSFKSPIFKNLKTLNLTFWDSTADSLIRAADIVANNVFHKAKDIEKLKSSNEKNLYLKFLP